MTRLELRVVVAAFLAATVVLGAVVCAAYGWTIVASVLSIYALGVGAWLYHSIERLIVARVQDDIDAGRSVARPLQPLLPVMAAIMGLTQAVVRSLSDVTELPARHWDLPVLRWMDGTRANRRVVDGDVEGDEAANR